MKRFILYTLCTCVFSLTACVPFKVNNKENAEKTIEISDTTQTYTIKNLPNFNAINAKEQFLVIYTPEGKPNVKITTNIKDISLIHAVVHDDELQLHYNVNSVNRAKTTVEISGYHVNDFDASSGATINVNRLLAKKDVSADASSGGHIDFKDCTSPHFIFDVSSAAKITAIRLKGEKLETDASSGGEIQIQNFNGSQLIAKASSAASISIGGTADKGKAQASSGAEILLTALNLNQLDAQSSSGATINCRTQHLYGNQSSGGNIINLPQ